MERYEHGGDIYGNTQVLYDFSVNTNPLGMPETIRYALQERVNEFEKYPDPHCRALRAALSISEGVPEDMILCGNGAADLIYRVCLALRPRRTLIPAPTFSEYERAIFACGGEVDYHHLSPGDGFLTNERICDDIDGSYDILFLCQPNNPTGRLTPEELLESIAERCAKTSTTLVVDECFLPFTAAKSVKGLLTRFPTLIVLKAFTKIYAMAGLRLGYLLCSDKCLLTRFSETAQCWSVSVPAQIAGEAALCDESYIPLTRNLIAAERDYLSEGLRKLGVTVYKSESNFILIRSDKPLYEPLLARGILLRSCANFIGLDGAYCRVAVRSRRENNALLTAIREIL